MITFGVLSGLKQLLIEVVIDLPQILQLIAMNVITIRVVQKHMTLNVANTDTLVDNEKSAKVMLKDGVDVVL